MVRMELSLNTLEKVNRSWGYYEVNEESENWKLKTLVVYPNRCLSYQVHDYRSELWLIKEGKGTAIIGEDIHILHTGMTCVIKAGEWHQLINGSNENLVIHEIQHGPKCDEEDITRL